MYPSCRQVLAGLALAQQRRLCPESWWKDDWGNVYAMPTMLVVPHKMERKDDEIEMLWSPSFLVMLLVV